jgi:predicted phosphodiesterase
MHALVLSDIHNNIRNVRLVRKFERNEFDVILVAGDIGDEAAKEFYSIMDTFECPTYCVFGNWDTNQSYRTRLSRNCRLIHHSMVRVGSFHITGFSGCPTSWGKNPVFLEEKRRRGTRVTYDSDIWRRTLGAQPEGYCRLTIRNGEVYIERRLIVGN